jgi:hypothetical protein
MSNGSSNDEPLIRAWEKTVDVQQHLDDLSLRIRNLVITSTRSTARTSAASPSNPVRARSSSSKAREIDGDTTYSYL